MSARRDPAADAVVQAQRLAARISDRPVDSWSLEQCELLNQSADRLHRAAWAAACWLASQRTAAAEGGGHRRGRFRRSQRL